jgi:glycosyltransferase involved in cell wall biosynthesis
LKFSILIDNFNYSSFLGDAIDSVLSQTYTDFEIVVVDDGSSDNSREIIEKYASKDTRIKAVFKSNGGQASAFNAGFEECAGDVVCFLDSDDMFAPTKLNELAEIFKTGAEYVYNDHITLFADGSFGADTLKRYPYRGYNLFLVYYMSKYPGDVCSTLSMSRFLAQKIFPLSDEEEWRIQADDCIVFQAAMMAKSHFLDKKLTVYRLHGANGHAGKKRSDEYTYKLLQRRNRLKDITLEKMGVSRTFLDNEYNLVAEFKTHEIMGGELLRLYLKTLIFEMNIPIFKKVETAYQLLKIYKSRKTIL